MLLYVVKHSRSDLLNMFCELSEFMDDVNIAAYKEMIRVIRFVVDTRNTCLKLKHNLEYEN
jgi:hypothetical protein